MPKIFTFFLDIIFPKFCLGCGIEGIWLCQKCFNSINMLEKQHCPICRNKNNGIVCNQCQNNLSLNGLLVSVNYENILVKKIIHYYKYQFIKELYLPLGNLLIHTINSNEIFSKLLKKEDTIIISIPLHKKRQLERGYNQSSLLAKLIAKKFNIIYYDRLIIRQKNTDIQAKLSKKERLKNLKSAFSIRKHFDLRDKNVIIIDDVATTLATLNSCAILLKKAGANQVWGLVIARGNYK